MGSHNFDGNDAMSGGSRKKVNRVEEWLSLLEDSCSTVHNSKERGTMGKMIWRRRIK